MHRIYTIEFESLWIGSARLRCAVGPAEYEKEITEACIRPPPNRTVNSRELSTGCGRPARAPRPGLAHRLDTLAGRHCVKPTPVIASAAAAPWPMTVVVPRHSRPAAHKASPPPAAATPPVAAATPSPASSAASAQLSQYSNDSGTRLSGVQLVGCRAGAPVSSWEEPSLASGAGRARLQ
ncbi:hypothetical protein FJT64_018919 [Amphibalanus amphitrite]|uniref:Uncharacterized protein n=1 Tax=Amphibalanus amphitrite TaxID=1232801 RepID=A0A6A4WT98_AMPAM|nr:hypothetical protein FJT64_018919 [Amphibalanus amphitrite]